MLMEDVLRALRNRSCNDANDANDVESADVATTATSSTAVIGTIDISTLSKMISSVPSYPPITETTTADDMRSMMRRESTCMRLISRMLNTEQLIALISYRYINGHGLPNALLCGRDDAGEIAEYIAELIKQFCLDEKMMLDILHTMFVYTVTTSAMPKSDAIKHIEFIAQLPQLRNVLGYDLYKFVSARGMMPLIQAQSAANDTTYAAAILKYASDKSDIMRARSFLYKHISDMEKKHFTMFDVMFMTEDRSQFTELQIVCGNIIVSIQMPGAPIEYTSDYIKMIEEFATFADDFEFFIANTYGREHMTYAINSCIARKSEMSPQLLRKYNVVAEQLCEIYCDDDIITELTHLQKAML
jgi:hypothetical protein